MVAKAALRSRNKPANSMLLFLATLGFATLGFATLGFAGTSAKEGSVPKDHRKFYASNVNKVGVNDEYCSVNQAECSKLKEDRPCWGYEPGCKRENIFSHPSCAELDRKGSAQALEAQKWKFWEQVDFGLVKKHRDEMMALCSPYDEFSSTLMCSPDMVFCRAKNLVMDFGVKMFDGRESFQSNFFVAGEIGGHCSLDSNLLSMQNKMRSDLFSWYDELQKFSSLKFNPIKDGKCDIVFDQPTFFAKQDHAGNMYHHFCDFINFFISQHINGSDFSTELLFINWDTSTRDYADKIFGDTWKVFTKYPLTSLHAFKGKKVCFRDAVFSVPPRNPWTLYYNTPFVSGCVRSGLVKAFSEHVLHRLQIQKETYQDDVVRILFLKRSTQFRRILNEDELVRAMRKLKKVSVRAVDYNWREIAFLEQLKLTSNSDVFIGIHGAGLTHLLFLPDWGAVFEVYNTEDPKCYMDLSRLRGIKYFTWEQKSLLTEHDKDKHERYGSNAKFWNYSFDVKEFMRIVKLAVKHVRNARPKLNSTTRR